MYMYIHTDSVYTYTPVHIISGFFLGRGKEESLHSCMCWTAVSVCQQMSSIKSAHVHECTGSVYVCAPLVDNIRGFFQVGGRGESSPP